MPEPTTARERKRERVQSLDRAFLLLEQLADAGEPLSLSELAEATSLPLPTVHRLLGFLTGQGYVQQTSAKRYWLGLRMIRLGRSASRGLGSWSTPFLNELVEVIGETANVAILQGDLCIYVAQVPSPQTVRMFTEVGRVVMPHCTGVGKAILSMLPDQEVEAFLERVGTPRRTDRTVTDPKAMLSVLATVRELGYAVDDGEQEVGVRCVAAPLRGLPFLAAVSVSGPSSRLRREDVPRVAPILLGVAAELSRSFPGSGTDRSELAG